MASIVSGYDVESTKLAIKEITSFVKSWESYGYKEFVLGPGDLIVSAKLLPTLYPSTHVERIENPLQNLLVFSALIGTVIFQDKYRLIFCGGEDLRARLKALTSGMHAEEVPVRSGSEMSDIRYQINRLPRQLAIGGQ
jgi:hypothetical protein